MMHLTLCGRTTTTERCVKSNFCGAYLATTCSPYLPVVPMATDPSFKYVINPNNEYMRYW